MKTKRGWRLGERIDSALFHVAPRLALKRMAARQQREFNTAYHERRMRLAGMAAGFESTRKDRFDASSWLTSELSIDSALSQVGEEMRERVNSLWKNEPLARGYVESQVSYNVGCGAKIKPRIREKEGSITADQATRWNAALLESFQLWEKRAGKKLQPLYILERQVERHWEKDGEAFVLFGDVVDPRSPVTLKIEVIHPRRVSTPYNQANNQNIRMGIETDPTTGLVVAYWVQTQNPGDTYVVSYGPTEWIRVPAYFSNGLPRMLHIYEELEAGQTRGYPEMQVSGNRFKNVSEYDEAELERNHIAACHAGFVTTGTDPADLADNTAAETTSGRRIQDIEPGTITYGLSGDEIDFSNPAGPQAAYSPYIKAQHQAIAAGVNWPYEMLTKNWAGLSYSAGRLIWNDADRPIRCRQKDLRCMFLEPVYQNFVNRAITSGVEGLEDISIADYRSQPWLYERARYLPDGRPWLDPTKEISAEQRAIEGGQETSQMSHGRRGLDTEEVYDDWVEDRRMREERGLPISQPLMNRDEPDASDSSGSDIGSDVEGEPATGV